jgi:predicted secreted protein
LKAIKLSRVLAAVALAFACVAAPATAQDRSEPLFNVVSLSAQAEREVVNDTLTAILAVDTEGTDPVALADSVNRAMREGLKLAQGYRGVNTKSLNYQTWPVYDKTRIVRWRVRQELRVESRDFAQATELIGKLQSTLVVSSLSVGLSAEARKQAENSLIGEALAAFHERAGIVRDAQKAKTYRVKELQVNAGGGIQPRMYSAQRAGVASAMVAQPAVEAGASTIQVSVSGSVQLQ